MKFRISKPDHLINVFVFNFNWSIWHWENVRHNWIDFVTKGLKVVLSFDSPWILPIILVTELFDGTSHHKPFDRAFLIIELIRDILKIRWCQFFFRALYSGNLQSLHILAEESNFISGNTALRDTSFCHYLLKNVCKEIQIFLSLLQIDVLQGDIEVCCWSHIRNFSWYWKGLSCAIESKESRGQEPKIRGRTCILNFRIFQYIF